MSIDTISIDYARTGRSTSTDTQGMRPMQTRVYSQRDQRFLLIKAPPASGKSRALMFVALYKLHQRQVHHVVVAVPERSIGGSFRPTKLTPAFPHGDWEVAPYFDLCDAGDERAKTQRFQEFFRQSAARILICTHATLRSAMKELEDSVWDDCLLAVDEFHHASADAYSGLGDVVRRVMNGSTGHVIAMTGSYFRGDGLPVLRPEDEARFTPVTYDYYEQLTGYQHLRRLRLGYFFYQGSYLDRLGEVLDTRKKTIIHIPSVNSRASTGNKFTEVETILNLIGKPDPILPRDPNRGGIYRRLRHDDGSLVLVADLVEDEAKERGPLQAELQKKLGRDDLDIIIALGTAKEGFDWEWCEQCLTIGVRGSLTEVIQIIGRCTRDCPGKSEASFVNLISQPDAQQEDVKVAVNDFIKAITASLLMEQVMSPRWDFRTAKDPDIDPTKPNAFTLTIHGLKPFVSDLAKVICAEQLDELKASTLQDLQIQQTLCGGVSPERINHEIIPAVIRRVYPELPEEDVEAVSQHLRASIILSGGTPVAPNTKEPISIEDFASQPESEGNRWMKLKNQFINIDDLSINLIDSLNPFQRGYEILSKHIDAPTLKAIQANIQARGISMTIEEAVALFPEYKARVVAGRPPSIKSPNAEEKHLAEAYEVLRALKLSRMQGLSYEEATLELEGGEHE